jgi:hypothetical protein
MRRKRKARGLAAAKRPKQAGSRLDRLLAISKDCAARMREPFKSMDIDELLYDEKGLPKSG